MSSACATASRTPKYTPRPVASSRPRTPPSASGLPVMQPAAAISEPPRRAM